MNIPKDKRLDFDIWYDSKTGKIILVDFGIIGILPEHDRLAIAEILHSFLKQDKK